MLDGECSAAKLATACEPSPSAGDEFRLGKTECATEELCMAPLGTPLLSMASGNPPREKGGRNSCSLHTGVVTAHTGGRKSCRHSLHSLSLLTFCVDKKSTQNESVKNEAEGLK